MSAEIITACIAAAGGLVGTIVGIKANTSIVVYRLAQLEKKVEKHNQVVERTYDLEKRADVFEEKIKVANHRLDDIEEEEKK